MCQYTANLAYQKESGAMNEAFSDIWAACIEHNADPDRHHLRPFSDRGTDNPYVHKRHEPQCPAGHEKPEWHKGNLIPMPVPAGYQ